jgi:hypothetical protein
MRRTCKSWQHCLQDAGFLLITRSVLNLARYTALSLPSSGSIPTAGTKWMKEVVKMHGSTLHYIWHLKGLLLIQTSDRWGFNFRRLQFAHPRTRGFTVSEPTANGRAPQDQIQGPLERLRKSTNTKTKISVSWDAVTRIPTLNKTKLHPYSREWD